MSEKLAFIGAFFGSSGSGKSAAVKQWLDQYTGARRLFIWDTMDEYGAYAKRCNALTAVLELSKQSEFAVRYVPGGAAGTKLADRFDTFCAIAYAAGDCALVVEELQTVTQPGRAPAAWSDCTLRGRHKGLRVIGVSQRPASVDKNFYSNATLVRTGRLNFVDDVRCMANILGVPDEQIAGMKPLEYVERHMANGQVSTGTLTFPAKSNKKK